MRSSKNRSRSKGNRNRSVGNIVNRVFDSSGPEGKVRGTPQQIIDKYNQLARDAQLSNDRVAAENFQQHAEHYLRMLAEAQREQDARNPQMQGGQPREGDERGDGYGYDEQAPQPPQPRVQPHFQHHFQPPRPARSEAEAIRQPEPAGGFDEVIDAGQEEDSGLVETPEAASKPKRSRSRRPKKPGDGAQSQGSDDGASGNPQEAAE
jgi:hypothetical protein